MTVGRTPTNCVAPALLYTISKTFWTCQSYDRSLHAAICRLWRWERSHGLNSVIPAFSFLPLRNYFCHLCRSLSATLWMPAGETVCERVPLFSYIMASGPFLWRPAFQPAVSTASRRCWRDYRLCFIDFKTTWVKSLTEMDEDENIR